MMAYPDICIRYCRNFGSNDCPTSSLCMATTDKPCLSCAMKWVICETPDGEIIERRHAKEYSRDLRKHEVRGTVRIQTLCWGCRNAYADKCSYHSRRHTPVDGWKVEASELYGERTHTVIECPKYEPDLRKA